MDYLQGLNHQQQQAVMAGLGPVLVLAGPGSGKTRVLTNRIAYLIGMMGVSPYHILAVTFTNKAAREMETRVTNLLANQATGLTLGTFHAICARLLRREAGNLPFDANFVIFDADDQLTLVKRAILEFNLDPKRFRPQAVHAMISNAKNDLRYPEQYPINDPRDEVVQRVYRRYQELLLVNNALDFDDLLLWTAYLLENFPVVRDKYARRYEHILVDEFQDTNLAQYVLLKHLASFHHNIYVVGDTDQSIYRWRGADYRNVLRFEKDFPDTVVVLLEQNYRSTQAILDVAMAVIDRNPYRTPKRLFTERGQGLKVLFHEANDDRVEAAFVVDTITGLVSRGQARPGDFAVMYRTNAQSRLLEEAFLHAGLPYRLVGAQRFYGRREIKDIIAYLRLVHNPSDELSLTRVINIPPRGIGDKTLLTLRTLAQRESVSPGAILLNLGSNQSNPYLNNFTGRAGLALQRFGTLLVDWQAIKNELPPLGLVDRILNDTDYPVYINDGTEEGKDRWENVLEFRRLAAEYQEQGLETFLEQIALVSDQDTIENNTNSPTLLTLHAAKGLEFQVVFIVGLSDGILPHSRSFDDPEAMMEERRLFYVGITRAMDRLYLVSVQNRIALGYSEPAEPSRFLSDIPNNLLDIPITAQIRRSAGLSGNSYERWGSTQPATGTTPRRVIKARFQPGMQVQHATWGQGLVLQSRLDGEDELVDVFFQDVGLKRVVASVARLEIQS